MNQHPLPDLCRLTRASFSSYLDGAVSGREMQSIAAHLSACEPCTVEFATWRTVQRTLATLHTNRAPEDLSLRLRLAISREQAARRTSWRDTLSLAWENTLRPLSVQVGAGLACAIVLLSTIVVLLGVVTPPNAVLANDEPLSVITAPHYLYSAVRPSPIVLNGEAGNITIVVEAMVNSNGRVYDYSIVSAPDGPEAPAIRAQVLDQLMLAVFKPASVFGVPVKGRVVMTLAGVSVHA